MRINNINFLLLKIYYQSNFERIHIYIYIYIYYVCILKVVYGKVKFGMHIECLYYID